MAEETIKKVTIGEEETKAIEITKVVKEVISEEDIKSKIAREKESIASYEAKIVACLSEVERLEKYLE